MFGVNSNFGLYAYSMAYLCLCQKTTTKTCACNMNTMSANVQWIEGAWPQTSIRAAVCMHVSYALQHIILFSKWHGDGLVFFSSSVFPIDPVKVAEL